MRRLRMLVVAGVTVGLVGVPAQPANAYYLAVLWDALKHSPVGDLTFLLDLEASMEPFAGPDPLTECIQQRPFRVQRYVDGRWKTVAKGKSNDKGRIKKTIGDKKGKYRVLVPQHTSESGFDCFKGTSKAKRHRH